MRACRPAGLSNITNSFPLTYASAFAHSATEAREVGIKCGVLVVVFENNDVAVSALLPNEVDCGVGGCPDRRSGWGSIVYALVSSPGFEYWVETSAKAGADPGELEGGAQKGFLQWLAIRCQVAAPVVALFVPERAVHLSCINEFCRDDSPATRWLPFLVAGFVGDGKAVAFA